MTMRLLEIRQILVSANSLNYPCDTCRPAGETLEELVENIKDAYHYNGIPDVREIK